jgi:aspartyl-tRNA(Asn)/glutamyl-tRNA(Gln) amidotransferase subunit A
MVEPVQTVETLLSIVGIRASDGEVRRLADQYPALRAKADALAPSGQAPDDGATAAPNATFRPTTNAAMGAVSGGTAPDGDAARGGTTVASLAHALRAGTVTSAALVATSMATIERRSDLGALVLTFPDSAARAAAQADADFRAGIDRGLLQGIPIVVKDILTTREGPTRAQSLVRTPFTDRRDDADAVARLREAGAIVVGKSSLSEFAIGRPDDRAGFVVPKHPQDLRRHPGGSSSGTAAAVAAGMVPAGLGTDTGGSIRIPSAFCGITGLKPTFGSVPTEGCVPLAPSFDTIGPMARTARDCALLFDVLTDRQPAGAGVPATASALDGDIAGVRIGIVGAKDLLGPDVEAGVDERLDELAELLEQLGADVRAVTLPAYRRWRIASMTGVACEAFAVHQRRLQDHWADYGSRTRMTLVQGALYRAVDVVRSREVAQAMRRDLAPRFEEADVLITPTMGMTAPRLDEDFWGRYLEMQLTSVWNLVGFPALSVPMGFGAGGLPLAAQLIGPPDAEAALLRAGDALQQHSTWHLGPAG